MKKQIFVIAVLYLATESIAIAETVMGWSFWGDARVEMSVSSYASDSLDSIDGPAIPYVNGWTAGTYHIKGIDGWYADSGFYRYDNREILLPGETKTWMLYIWVSTNATPSEFYCFWRETNISDMNLKARLEFIQKPLGITGGPAIGTVWTKPPGQMRLPYFSTSNGLEGYCFKFTITRIPEPSPILALISGLCGTVGLAWRCKHF